VSNVAVRDRVIMLPVDMSDGMPNPVTSQPWDGSVELAVDRAIRDTRSIVYPLHGLDAHDPRDQTGSGTADRVVATAREDRW